MYTPYVTAEEYAAMGYEAFDGLDEALKVASRHIDTLTFNRIVEAGLGNLTEFQREIVKEVVCKQTAFEHDHADELETVLSSYSVNGVTMQFGDGWTVSVENGVPILRTLYSYLQQTGLCCRVLR